MTALPAVLADPAQRGPLEARVSAAAALGAGDPRLGSFARIPAGTARLGSDPPEGSPSEHPSRQATLGAYEIGSVPVTVAEFARFVARGYRERTHWSDEGWEWRSASAIDRPRFWGEEAWRAYLGESHPVVGVSWFEAEAYARFAGARLPTEEEWERAARGEDGRRYPWGDGWDPGRAAHRGGPRHTLPVGCFPAGRSPHGLWDAAGNVWEWCARGQEAGAAAAPSRQARGGAWNALPAQLRCAQRNAWPPRARYSNIGFRLAR